MWALNSPEDAILFEKKACSLGDKQTCAINSARLARAMIFKSKCDDGAGGFCLEFALFAGLDGQDTLGVSYLEKGCRLRNKASCEGAAFYRQAKARKELNDSQKNKMPNMAIPMSADAAPTIRIANPRYQREPSGSDCESVGVAEIFTGKPVSYRVCRDGWKVPTSDRED